VKFKANVWNRLESSEVDLGTGPPKPPTSDEDEDVKTWEAERKWAPKSTNKPTDVQEVWFAGCHCDVGGGSVLNSTRNSLARIPLRWMVRECFKTNSGIKFESDKLRLIGLDPSHLYDENGEARRRPEPISVGSAKIRQPPPTKPSFLSRILQKMKELLHLAPLPKDQPPPEDVPPVETTTEEQEELWDALSPMFDQLEIQPWYKWKFLEWLPLAIRYQKADNSWVTSRKCNRGKPRIIPWQKDGLNVHRSVLMRMGAQLEGSPGKTYMHKAEFDVKPNWVA